MQNTKTEYSSSERMPVVLPEMEQLLPPLSAEQLFALEEDILESGCYAPIIVNEDSSTVASMLENELYLGNTINMKYGTKSYKDKRHVEHPKEECMVLEGTHPALVTKEVWDIVQRVRQNKRRRTNGVKFAGWNGN